MFATKTIEQASTNDESALYLAAMLNISIDFDEDEGVISVVWSSPDGVLQTASVDHDFEKEDMAAKMSLVRALITTAASYIIQ
ncbi:PH domain-containing protein [Klebsiella quasipneumoniae]|uniref:hypothetical protein n=1 Tax=Klebsiella quasipneumoniae TaxID=1463165 RepID=UPI002DBB484E|nr:hypothetical protein [Klebsiella quasipneumoniae]MEB5816713.1 hypothetical protein [Klebsiella quasipneumoniae]